VVERRGFDADVGVLEDGRALARRRAERPALEALARREARVRETPSPISVTSMKTYVGQIPRIAGEPRTQSAMPGGPGAERRLAREESATAGRSP
jgi:hypothetical protein